MKKFLMKIVPTLHAQIDLKKASIKAGGAEIKMGEGTLSFSQKRNMQYTLNKGKLDEVREGDEVPMDVKLDGIWEYVNGQWLTEILDPTITSDTDPCRPKACDIVIALDPGCGSGGLSTVTLPDFRWEDVTFDAKAGTISITGKCNVTAPIWS